MIRNFDCKRAIETLFVYDDITKMYFCDIRKHKVLDDGTVRKLIKRYRNGNEKEKADALNKIFLANQRFVVSVAKHYTNGDNFLDLVNEGNLGLYEAIDRFDLSQKSKFLTYAVFWITKYVNNFVATDNIVKPRNWIKVKTYVSKAEVDFIRKNERTPTQEELQDFLIERGVKIAHKEDLSGVTKVFVEENVDDETLNYKHYIEYNTKTCNNSVDEYMTDLEIKENVEMLLSALTEEERLVIELRFGLGDYDSHTFKEIAFEMNTDIPKVNRLHSSAMKKMTKMSNKFRNEKY